MEPSDTRSGELNLQMKFIGLVAAVKKSSLGLFWAYNAPKELNISEWPGGLISFLNRSELGDSNAEVASCAL
jgi:hypothetical protein